MDIEKDTTKVRNLTQNITDEVVKLNRSRSDQTWNEFRLTETRVRCCVRLPSIFNQKQTTSFEGVF